MLVTNYVQLYPSSHIFMGNACRIKKNTASLYHGINYAPVQQKVVLIELLVAFYIHVHVC